MLFSRSGFNPEFHSFMSLKTSDDLKQVLGVALRKTGLFPTSLFAGAIVSWIQASVIERLIHPEPISLVDASRSSSSRP